jgi:hypothetical protein
VDAVPVGAAADGAAPDGAAPDGAAPDGALEDGGVVGDGAAAAWVIPGSGAGVGGATLPWQAASASARADGNARG